jgi:hypothetical protein
MNYPGFDPVTTRLRSTPVGRRCPFYPLFLAVQLLERAGFKVIVPKGGRPPTIETPEVKATLLGLVHAEAELVARRKGHTIELPFDQLLRGLNLSVNQLLLRVQKRGYFPKLKYSTLKAYYSDAKKWVQTDEAARWLEEEAKWAEQFLQQQSPPEPFSA